MAKKSAKEFQISAAEPGTTGGTATPQTKADTTLGSSTDESVLVTKLLEAKDNILATDSGFKHETWVEVEKALQGSETKSGRALKTVEWCKTHWTKIHKSVKCWQTTSFPLYDAIAELLDGVAATGSLAFHPMLLMAQM
ncbi:hypothetical protein BKA82DRAFT_11522 [Pisolithus tinctorius]|uniref:Myb/SANT-like domain-containing protein n=1 Tax=Pisolithus tinctorius Marx 270 TaxID=870435 RepID=A0A0C3J5H0_PISTI|nr:hypothetical protein BKA82DRAFT_11522 [Pisolithus tinctorius]KIN92941.1 hypothetical protein M404DRAFT_11522 [Pisolithus tinctorius Marx 270]